VIPILTPEEMAEVDRAAPEPVEVLIERAGAAVARAAMDLLGGTYGRRVVVIAGKGNNGNDGRAAAERLRRRGVRVVVVDATGRSPLPASDLVIDAAYGTGFRGEHHPVRPASGTPVLAVDIPSGVDGLTGAAAGHPLTATRTVTFAALKPGLLLGAGPDLAGDITVADIGLDATAARAHLVEAVDVAGWLPTRARDAHKWQAAAWVVAGSAGMLGAAHLCARAAQRAGAGYVRLSSPGVEHDPLAPTEAVLVAVEASGWDADVVSGCERFGALAVGPGLGTSDATAAAVRATVAGAPVPMVVDGDGLNALATAPGGAKAALARRSAPTVLTPHDGEFARLAGGPPGGDRLGAVRALAAETGTVVVSKGSTSVVADPAGTVLVSTTGDARLATAGTGDVLTGVVCALLAQQVPALRAAAAGAFLHGRAGAIAWPRGMVAGDLTDLLPFAFSELPEAGCSAPPPSTRS
jgi:NAD(P)H-hydrate epimerase